MDEIPMLKASDLLAPKWVFAGVFNGNLQEINASTEVQRVLGTIYMLKWSEDCEIDGKPETISKSSTAVFTGETWELITQIESKIWTVTYSDDNETWLTEGSYFRESEALEVFSALSDVHPYVDLKYEHQILD